MKGMCESSDVLQFKAIRRLILMPLPVGRLEVVQDYAVPRGYG